MSLLDNWTSNFETVSASQVSRDSALVTGVTIQAAVTGLSVRLDVHLPLCGSFGQS